MTKTEAIHKFKQKCNELINLPKKSSEYISWKNTVEKQHNRDVWDLISDYSLIRIRKSPSPTITVFHHVTYKGEDAVSEFELTSDEYKELETKYFGGHKLDEDYFKRIEMLNS